MAAAVSPCNNVCSLGDREICVGCGRTLAEIAEWGRAGDKRRHAIVAAAKGRLQETQ